MNKSLKKLGILGLSALMALVMAVPVFADDSSNAQSASDQNSNAYWTDNDLPQLSASLPAIDPRISTELNVYQEHGCGFSSKPDGSMEFEKKGSTWADQDVELGYQSEWDELAAIAFGTVPNEKYFQDKTGTVDERKYQDAKDKITQTHDSFDTQMSGLDFSENMLLEKDKVENKNSLTVTGDLSRIGQDESCAPGDNFGLNFSVSAPWLAQYVNTWITEMMGNLKMPLIKMDSGAISDNELVFTLDIPKGVDAAKLTKNDIVLQDKSGTLSVKDVYYNSSSSQEQTDNKQGKLYVYVGLKEAKSGSLKDYWINLNKAAADTQGTVSIGIQNLKVDSDAAEGIKHIRGTVSGINDVAVQMNEFVGGLYIHNCLSFAGIQSSEGADKLAGDFGKDKPKQISYSFKVSTPTTPVTPVEDHTVTFHPANGQSDFTQTVADGNKVSQPAEPVQDGYTFNGWYTDSALTNAYDFNTPVKNDMDLYAKWTKNTPETNPETNKVTGILLPKVIANGSSKQTLTWTPLTNVDGYYVYEAYCNTYKHVHPFKKVADVSASSPRVYKRSGLKKGAAYKYYVAGYKIKNGKKQVVKKSVTVHSAAGNLLKTKNVKYTNVKSVSVKKNAVTLKVGKTYRIQPSAKGVYSGYAILQKGHAAMFRYLYIKDGKNIKVSQNGTVKALKAGKCNVYVLGTNGVRTKVAVTVVK